MKINVKVYKKIFTLGYVAPGSHTRNYTDSRLHSIERKMVLTDDDLTFTEKMFEQTLSNGYIIFDDKKYILENHYTAYEGGLKVNNLILVECGRYDFYSISSSDIIKLNASLESEFSKIVSEERERAKREIEILENKVMEINREKECMKIELEDKNSHLEKQRVIITTIKFLTVIAIFILLYNI